MKRWAAVLVCASLLGSCARSVRPDLTKAPTRDLRLALILAPSFRDDGLTASLREAFKSVIVVDNTKQAKVTRADLFGTVGPEKDLRLMSPDFEPVEAIPLTRLRQTLVGSPKLAAFADSVKQKLRPKGPKPSAPSKEPVLDLDVPAYKLAERPDDYALVIGIEEYRSAPPARSAQKDAEAVRAHLAALGYPERNIFVLTGESATRAAIAESVESWLPKSVRRKSRVFFYFAGSGLPGYLLSWDGSVEFPATTSYPLQRLYEKLNSLRAKEVLMVLDACLPSEKAPPGKLMVLAAPPCDERSGDLTRRLLNALNESRGVAGFRELSHRLK
ncbi:MAG: caspase family protein [Elusimicrobiota bacterium]